MQACKFVGLMIPLCAAMDPSPRMGWLKHVQADRHRVNPFVGQPEAIAREDECLKTTAPHVTDQMSRRGCRGRAKRPSLRSDRVHRATDGKIFWLLRNGSLPKGMPTWAALPEPTRWQIIPYIKSLGSATPAAAPALLLASRIRYDIGMCRTPSG